MANIPTGFRAVRIRGKTGLVYCVDRLAHMSGGMRKGTRLVDVYTTDGNGRTMSAKAFSANYAREYSPMPDAVRAMFQGKPSFTQWWTERGKGYCHAGPLPPLPSPTRCACEPVFYPGVKDKSCTPRCDGSSL